MRGILLSIVVLGVVDIATIAEAGILGLGGGGGDVHHGKGKGGHGSILSLGHLDRNRKDGRGNGTKHEHEEISKQKDEQGINNTRSTSEKLPNDEAKLLVDYNWDEIKNRSESILIDSFPQKFSGFTADTKIEVLGYINYTEPIEPPKTAEIFLVRVIFDWKYIFHIKMLIEPRGNSGLLFGKGMQLTSDRKVTQRYVSFSTVIRILGPKKEDEALTVDEFNTFHT